MRLLILSDAISPHTENWCNQLVERGCEVKLLSLSPVADRTYDQRVQVVSLNRTGSYSKLDYLKIIILANYYSLFWRPNFVNAMYATVYGGIGLLTFFTPLITSVWGSDVLIRPRRSKFARFVVRRVLRKSRAVFATSRILAHVSRVYTNRPIFVVPFGVHESKIESALASECKFQKQEGVIRIGCIKWMKKIYGIDSLLYAFHELVNERKDENFELLLTGDGPDKEYFIGLARELSIEDRVVFTGTLESDEIYKVHKSLDIAVYPSLSESFGVSIIESAVANVPIVASNIGGIPEITDEGRSALLVAPGDPNAIKAAIVKYLDNGKLKQANVESFKKRVINKYTWSQCTSRYLKILDVLDSAADRYRYLMDENNIDGSDLFVFHYPGPLESSNSSARPIRVRSMLKEISTGQNTYMVMGRRPQRRQQYALLRYLLDSGVACSGYYFESHTNATPLIENLRRPDVRLTDFRVMRLLKKRGISTKAYLRDIHWRFPFYRKLVGKKVFYYKLFFYYLDLVVYRRYIDTLFLPSSDYQYYLPKFMQGVPRIETLMPGTSCKPKPQALIIHRDMESCRSGVIKPFGTDYEYFYTDTVRFCQINADTGVLEDVLFKNTPRDYRAISVENANFDLNSISLVASYLRNSTTVLFASKTSKFLTVDGVNPLTSVKAASSRSQLEKVVREAFMARAGVSFLYTGGIGDLYQVETFIRAFSVLKGGACLTMVCRPKEVAAFAKRAPDLMTIPNIRFIERDRDWLLRNSHLFDYGLVTLGEDEYLTKAAPMKIFDYFSMGLPIIISENIEFSRTVCEKNLGWSVVNKESSISEVLDEVTRLPRQDCLAKKESVRQYAEQNTWAMRAMVAVNG